MSSPLTQSNESPNQRVTFSLKQLLLLTLAMAVALAAAGYLPGIGIAVSTALIGLPLGALVLLSARSGNKRRAWIKAGMAMWLAAGLAFCWWASWPSRSASQFVKLMATNPGDARELSSSGSGMWRVLERYKYETPYYEPRHRTIADVLHGRQEFTVFVPTDANLDGSLAEFSGTLIVERGKISGPIELDSRKWERE